MTSKNDFNKMCEKKSLSQTGYNPVAPGLYDAEIIDVSFAPRTKRKMVDVFYRLKDFSHTEIYAFHERFSISPCDERIGDIIRVLKTSGICNENLYDYVGVHEILVIENVTVGNKLVPTVVHRDFVGKPAKTKLIKI